MSDATREKESLLTTDGDIDLAQLLSLVWRGKAIWIAGLLLGCALAWVYGASLPDKYSADVLVMAADGSQGVSELGGAVGALAGIAGIQVGRGSDRSALALETLKSRAFLLDFLASESVYVPVLAAKGWDSERGNWLWDESIYDPVDEAFINGYEVSLLRAYHKFLDEHLSVYQNKSSGLSTLSVKSYSPAASKVWLDKLVARVNSHMKQLDKNEAEKNLAFLESKLEQTDIAEMKAAFYELIEQQIKTIMLTDARENYALRIIDPAVTPEWPAEPNRKVVVAVGGGCGLLLGLIVSLFLGLRASPASLRY